LHGGNALVVVAEGGAQTRGDGKLEVINVQLDGNGDRRTTGATDGDGSMVVARAGVGRNLNLDPKWLSDAALQIQRSKGRKWIGASSRSGGNIMLPPEGGAVGGDCTGALKRSRLHRDSGKVTAGAELDVERGHFASSGG